MITILFCQKSVLRAWFAKTVRYSRSIYSVRITVFENMQLCKLILYVNTQKEALGKCKLLYISLHFFYEVETRNIISLVYYFFYYFLRFFLN